MGPRRATVLALFTLGCSAFEHAADPGARSEGGSGGLGSDPACPFVKSGDEEVRLQTQDDVEALRQVWRVEGALSITGTVNDLSPLTCLREVTGDVRVYDAPNLVHLSGLEKLTKIGGTLDIQPECSGEGYDQDCGPSVLETVVLAGLREVGTVTVRMNLALVEARFDAIERGTVFRFVELPALRSVHFPSLVTVESFALGGTRLLEEADFPSLTSAESIGLTVTGLRDLGGLRALTELGGLYLYGNAQLSSLDGLEMTTLARLTLEANPSLVMLPGLNALVAVEESLWIRGNPSLVSLDGLENLARVGQLTIVENPMLPTCEAEWLRDHIGATNISGPIQIGSNDDAASCQ